MTQLVTLQELKEFLSINPSNTTEDGRLSNIAIQVGSLVSSYCGREFSASDYLEFFNGGQSSIFVSNPPINSVNELSYYTGSGYTIVGGPDVNGRPVTTEGTAHSITSIGNPLTKTRTKKFGRSSMLLTPGSSLVTDSSDDWDLGTDDFTLEFFIRFNLTNYSHTIVSSGTMGDEWIVLFDPVYDGMVLVVHEASSTTLKLSEGSPSYYAPNIFYHIVIERIGNLFNMYRDGVLIASETSYVSIPNYGTGITIGKDMHGYIDNLRISHSATYYGEFNPVMYQLPATADTRLLLNMDENNNSNFVSDTSRNVNGFSYYKDTGEIYFGSSSPDLALSPNAGPPNYPNGVSVSYNGGFRTIPADLKMAIMEMVKIIYKGKTGTDVIWHGKDKAEAMPLAIDGFPPHVRRVLSLYRLID